MAERTLELHVDVPLTIHGEQVANERVTVPVLLPDIDGAAGDAVLATMVPVTLGWQRFPVRVAVTVAQVRDATAAVNVAADPVEIDESALVAHVLDRQRDVDARQEIALAVVAAAVPVVARQRQGLLAQLELAAQAVEAFAEERGPRTGTVRHVEVVRNDAGEMVETITTEVVS